MGFSSTPERVVHPLVLEQNLTPTHTLKMKTKGIMQKVSYTAISQPIGKVTINYSTYLESLAHNGWVPIICPDWHHTNSLKLDMIWKEIKISSFFNS